MTMDTSSKRPVLEFQDPLLEALKRIDKMTWTIMTVLVIGFVTMLLMVIGLVLDAWRFKTNSYESLTETIKTQEKIINQNQIERDEIKNSLDNIQKTLPTKK